MSCIAWRKSSHSEPDGGNCVEVAGVPGGVAIRDSKNPAGSVLIVSAPAWRRFLDGVASANRTRA